jgi:hypothetical protein
VVGRVGLNVPDGGMGDGEAAVAKMVAIRDRQSFITHPFIKNQRISNLFIINAILLGEVKNLARNGKNAC